MSAAITENPITVKHLQVYFDLAMFQRDGKGFCVGNSDGSMVRFEHAYRAAYFVMDELQRLENQARDKCNIVVPNVIEVHDSALPRLEECKKFLADVEDSEMRVQLWKTLQDSLEHIGRIANNYPDDPATLFRDFAPLSFGWCAGNLTGGLIFHGEHDGHGGGGAPTFSVSLDSTTGWQLHT